MNKPIYIATSPWLITVASIFYVTVVFALYIANIPWWLRYGVWALLLLDYLRIISLYGLRTHKNAVQILLEDCQEWRYCLASGREAKGHYVKSRSFCNSLVLILCIQHLHTARYVVIPRDAVSNYLFRYLTYKMQLKSDIIKSMSD